MKDTNLDKKEIFKKADHNLRESIKNIAANSPDGEVVETEDYLIFTIGRRTLESHANGAFCLNDEKPEVAFKAAEKFFKERNLDYVFWVMDDKDENMEAYLREKGYEPRREPGITIMTIEEKLELPEMDKRYELSKVRSIKETRDYMTVVRDAFGLEENTATAMFGNKEVLNGKQTEGYVVYDTKCNRPVSAVQVFYDGDVSGIYWVATSEDYRGQGLGKYITSVGTNAGFDLGSYIVILQASVLGEYVYKKLGYDTRGYYRTYRIIEE